jgi:hypothetical protein
MRKFLKLGIFSIVMFILCFLTWHFLPIKKRIVFAQNIELACPSPLTSLGNIFDIRSPSTGGIRQYFCIDPNGNLNLLGFSANPQLTFSGFLAAPNNIGNITFIVPSKPITVVRLTGFVQTPAAGCSTFPIWAIFDNTTLQIVTSVTAGTTQGIDGGPVSISVPATHPIFLRVTTSGVGCGTAPLNLNLVMTYQMQ